jgi:F1F0 ATPase subunit 2
VNVPIVELGVALAVGAALGVWFFGGLLWTVRRMPAARRPVLLMLASFGVRAAVVAAGVVWLASRHWLLPLVALAGFVAVRTWMLSTRGAPRLKGDREAS